MLCLPSQVICNGSGPRFRTFLSRHRHRLHHHQRASITTVRFSPSTNAAEPEPEEHHYDTPFIVFDTAKNSKCRLTTRRKNVLTWYSCGPTVYDSAHIGHASSFVRQDVIRRILEGVNKEVTVIQVMGITDIDDKIIRKANEIGVEWNSVSKQFEREFVEDLTSLNVLPPHVFTRVSDYIPQILQFVGKLIESGYAYQVQDGSVYFDTEKYGDRYGIFRQNEGSSDEANLEEGAATTTTTSDGKRSARDFALWKGAKPGEPFWPSPWGSGKGRPGWHIECSVMASQYFGPCLDLHTGGRDLIFPHHENEEAQCCAHFQSSQWTSHWLHMGHLHFKGDVKMSKSLGNTVTIRKFLEEHSPDLLRVMCINAKYRKNIEYSPDTLDIAKKILRKLHSFLNDTGAILNGTKQVQLASSADDDNSLWIHLENARTELDTALLNDFDTPEALKIVTELISDFNRHYVPPDNNSNNNDKTFSLVNYQLVLAVKIFVQDFLKLVGISLSPSSSSISSNNTTISQDLRLENVLNQFVQFRNQVRSYSLAMDETSKETRKEKITQRKELLQACDKVRNEMLTENSIEIKDHGKTSSWSFVIEPSSSK